MNVKIFKGYSSDDVEIAINEWINDNPNYCIISIHPYITSLYELYANMPVSVCNSWNEYIWTIIYKNK